MSTPISPPPLEESGKFPLFDSTTRGVQCKWASKKEKEFARFHEKNPIVYRLFVQYAVKLRAAGWKHYSARAIIYGIRLHHDIETKSEDGFKINNNHSPYYARKMVRDFPEFGEFFELRRLK